MLPVLMYHGVHAGPDARGFYDPVYSVHPREFECQLDWLAQHHYRTLLLHEIDRLPRERSVVISFDDGDVSNREIALPALQQRGMRAEFFVTTDFIGRRGSLQEHDIRALADAGMGIQSHGCTHRYLEDLDEADLESELRQSKRALERLVGRPVIAVALPGGRGSERERLAAHEAGYRYALNSVPGCNASWLAGHYLRRLPVTRDLSLAAFARLVQWRGPAPRLLQARYEALALAKRVLGNRRYERWRGRVVWR